MKLVIVASGPDFDHKECVMRALDELDRSSSDGGEIYAVIALEEIRSFAPTVAIQWGEYNNKAVIEKRAFGHVMQSVQRLVEKLRSETTDIPEVHCLYFERNEENNSLQVERALRYIGQGNRIKLTTVQYPTLKVLGR